MALHVAFLFFAEWISHHYHPTGYRAYLIAALPAFAIIAVLFIAALYFKEETDEFERSIVIQSQLWGIGGTLAITTFWGILEIFLPITHFPTYLTSVIYWICVGIATPLIRLRYR
jgi:hypothetical protein